MTKRLDIIASALALIVAATGIAEARTRLDDVRQIVAKVKAAYNSTQSAVVKFTQTSAAGTSNGTLTYAPGDRYRLELSKQTLVSDGRKVWTYNPEKKQVVISKPAQGTGKLTPSEILTSFPGDYATELVGEQKINGRAVWVIRCTPGGGKKVGDVERATLYVDKSTYRFQQVDIVSPSVGNVTLRILSAQYSAKIPDSQFTFTPSKDTRVVDLSR